MPPSPYPLGVTEKRLAHVEVATRIEGQRVGDEDLLGTGDPFRDPVAGHAIDAAVGAGGHRGMQRPIGVHREAADQARAKLDERRAGAVAVEAPDRPPPRLRAR